MLTAPNFVNPYAGLDLVSLLEQRGRQRGAHPLLVWSPLDGAAETWSYARFADAAARMAGGLAARGVRPGDRVLVLLENCPEALLTLFACARLGAIYVPINALAAGPELAWYAEFVGAVGAVTQPSLSGALSSHCPGLKWIAVTGTAEFESLYREPPPLRPADPAQPAVIMFTTGTTSRPKGVVWTHANALWGAQVNAMHQALRAEDVYHVFLPLFHVVGLSWSFLPALWAGATTLLQPRFSASRYWPAALAHGATVGSHVIFSVRVLSQQPAPPDHRFRQWLDALYRPEVEERFGIRVVSAWGMTEIVGQGIVGDPWLPQRPGSIGRPSPAYRIRVVDDAGRAVEPGALGYLRIAGERGLQLFAEYYRNPDATREAFDADGYFDTGDRVILHEDGCIQFSERAKDVIKVGGEGVSPAEIERVVLEVQGVKEAAVVAKPDADYGEVAAAFVVLSEGTEPDEARERVLAHCRASLAKFKVPREVITLAALPLVGNGKIAKAQLRARFSK
jgi:crotonobetaine/carnitine-CoA ligase